MAKYGHGPLPALLADDEPALRGLLTYQATMAGYTVAPDAPITSRVVQEHPMMVGSEHSLGTPALFAEIEVSSPSRS